MFLQRVPRLGTHPSWLGLAHEILVPGVTGGLGCMTLIILSTLPPCRGTADWFGVSKDSDSTQKWQRKSLRHCSQRYGKLKPQVMRELDLPSQDNVSLTSTETPPPLYVGPCQLGMQKVRGQPQPFSPGPASLSRTQVGGERSAGSMRCQRLPEKGEMTGSWDYTLGPLLGAVGTDLVSS